MFYQLCWIYSFPFFFERFYFVMHTSPQLLISCLGLWSDGVMRCMPRPVLNVPSWRSWRKYYFHLSFLCGLKVIDKSEWDRKRASRGRFIWLYHSHIINSWACFGFVLYESHISFCLFHTFVLFSPCEHWPYFALVLIFSIFWFKGWFQIPPAHL